jgi:2-oxo-4-hydroxy-4-carboxy-5-ureidoimidazoline decarboxylase
LNGFSQDTAVSVLTGEDGLMGVGVGTGVVSAGPVVGELAQKVRMSQLDRFNALPPDEAREALTACCASRRWVDALTLARPYRGVAEFSRTAEAALGSLDWSDVLESLAAHPRIGERAAGSGREASWSRGEQAGAGAVGARTAAELAAANVAYERRFGHVFLIRAAGRGAQEMLDAAHERLGNDEPTERAVVRGELGQIVRLRLEKLLDGLGAVISDPVVPGPAVSDPAISDPALGD